MAGDSHKMFRYEKINPLAWLAQFRGFRASPRHVTFDPDVKPQYRIIRTCAHDGTLLFMRELIESALVEPIMYSCSYYKPEPPPEGARIHYTLGWMRLISVYGIVNLPAGRYPGERQRVIVPVRCEFFYADVPESYTKWSRPEQVA